MISYPLGLLGVEGIIGIVTKPGRKDQDPHRHAWGVAASPGAMDEVMRCPFCSYVAADKEDYRIHVREAHPDKAD